MRVSVVPITSTGSVTTETPRASKENTAARSRLIDNKNLRINRLVIFSVQDRNHRLAAIVNQIHLTDFQVLAKMQTYSLEHLPHLFFKRLQLSHIASAVKEHLHLEVPGTGKALPVMLFIMILAMDLKSRFEFTSILLDVWLLCRSTFSLFRMKR